jgi:carboxylesterase type B
VASFGGDPSRVTVVGAGPEAAALTHLLLATPVVGQTQRTGVLKD